MNDPILTEKGNILPPEVWVTFWNIYSGEQAYLDGVSNKPWGPTYDAPITTYADNVRYVPAVLLEAANAEIERLKAVIENDADWKFTARRRLRLFSEQRARADAAEQREKLAYTAGYVDGSTGCPHRVTGQIGVAIGDET